MLNQLEQPAPQGKTALLQLGFRPFFAGAAIFSILSMLAWSGLYVFNMHWYQATLPAVTWHAHEMVYGYGLAVIAGFLLTAVKNWTGVQTLRGVPPPLPKSESFPITLLPRLTAPCSRK